MFCKRLAQAGTDDELVNTAIATGGRTEDQPQAHGFMYDWSFLDLDGHRWGVMWMDPAALQQPMSGTGS